MKARSLLLVLAVAALALSSCAKKRADAVPDEALDAIARAAEADLNAPASAIFGLLKADDDSHVVRWDDLAVSYDNKTWPVNGWLYRHGYLDLSGLPVTQGAPFLLAKKAIDAVGAGDQPWFTVAPDAATHVDCTSATLPPGACEVDLPLKPSLTDAGTAAGVGLPGAFTVQAQVVFGADGWEVTSLTPQGARAVHNITLDALLGPEGSRAAQMAALNQELAGKIGALGPPAPADRSQPLGASLAAPAPPQAPPQEALPSAAPTEVQYGPGGRQRL